MHRLCFGVRRAVTIHSGEKVMKWRVEFCVTAVRPASVAEKREVQSPALHWEVQRLTGGTSTGSSQPAAGQESPQRTNPRSR